MGLKPITVEDELRRTFELATLRKEARGGLQTSRQWREATKLQTRCKEAIARERTLFARRYDTRVETARQRLIAEAGRKGATLKPWWAGDDRFSPAAILRQAQREVRQSHEQRIDRINEFERLQLSRLVERSRRENRLQDVARDAFNQAADRRTGQERRRVRPREH